MNKISISICALALAATFPASAVEVLEGRSITSVGCHTSGTNTTHTCFVAMDGETFGQTLGCSIGPTKEFRFDNGETQEGRRAYASFLAAHLAGHPLNVTLNGCSVQGYPLLSTFRVR